MSRNSYRKAGKLCSRLALLASLLLSQAPAAQIVGPSRDTPVDQEGWRQVGEEFRKAKPPRRDETFEAGRDIFQGNYNHQKLNYCVVARDDSKSDEEQGKPLDPADLESRLVPLSKESLRPLRKLGVNEFANELYDCDDVGAKVLNKIAKEDAGLVIYYLNAEYKLRLSQEKGGGDKARRFP